MIVTTEKDMVKLMRLDLVKIDAPLYALSIVLELVEGAKMLDAMLSRLVTPGDS